MAVTPLTPVRNVRTEAVSFDSVRKTFDRTVAVDGLSFEVPSGTIYGLLGPNGAGKTTSIRILMGILGADEGHVQVLGGAPGGDVCERIGYLPEERGLYPGMTVLDNLSFFGSIRGLGSVEARRRATLWLHRVGMAGLADRRLRELSKGNQQKIQFLATVLHEPELLVLDEPFSGLDPVNQDLFRGILLELAAEGRTIILSTHLMDEVERLCSRIALVHAGRALVEGPLDDIKRRHGSDTIALEVAGDAGPLGDHPDVAALRSAGRSHEVRLVEGTDPSRWLAEIAARVPITRFEVRAASLHSIFVELVGAAAGAADARDGRDAAGEAEPGATEAPR